MHQLFVFSYSILLLNILVQPKQRQIKVENIIFPLDKSTLPPKITVRGTV